MKKILITLLLLLTACSPKNNDEYLRGENTSTTSGFDTVMTLIAYTKSEKEFDTYFELMKNEFFHYHQLFDKYNSYDGINNLKTINDNAGIKAIEVDPAIIDLLEEAKLYSSYSDYFDITLGAMLTIWHDYREEGISANAEGEFGDVPTEEELLAAMALTGWDKVVIDKEKNTVYLTEKGVSLDVGAIAKGYATEMVARKLEAEGLEMALVSGGGNIRSIGTKPDNVPWGIGIQEPTVSLSAKSVDVFSIPHSISIVTSGDYQRTYQAKDGQSYSHLINPKTMMPARYFRSLTVITENSTMADALSTALFMMTYEEGTQFIEAFNVAHPDKKISAFWIVDDNATWYQGESCDYMMTGDLIQYSKNQK